MAIPTLDQSVADLHRIGKQLATRLRRLQLATVRDLLLYVPVRHDDLRSMTDIAALAPGVQAVVRGRVVAIANRRAHQRRMLLTEAVVQDATGSVRCVWFQQPYVAHAYPAGTAVVLAGTPTVDRYGLQLTSPVIERDSEVNLHAGRLVPIYALTAGVTQKQLRFLVSLALPAAGQMTDPLSDTIRVREKLLSRADAIRSVHFPADDAERAAAQERLLFDDIVRYILRVRASREEMEEACAPRIIVNAAMVERVKGALPFVLTGAQERAVGEILGDMNASTPPRPPSQREGGDLGGKPMQRLLNGDVGSGKTAVAAVAAAVVADAGRQVAYLAPTEVLTVQQAAVLTRWLQPLGISVACWTRTTRRIDGTPVTLAVLRAAVRSGAVRVVVGTHAILADAVQFSDLALAIIDEQHRFGVEQRAALRKKARVSDDGVACMPHLLSMTATPIPRTLQLSLLGDLAVSVLDERPQARRPVATSVIVPAKRLEMTHALKEELAAGHQAFIVCGKIDDDGGGELATVTEAFERAKRAFPDACIGLLHGRMKPVEQQAAMEAFAMHETDILVATTVIEVGVDQPNATLMIIEDAERFGLSQLHQLRGRVGRGAAPGRCFLATRVDAPQVRAHLSRVAQTTDGFALAEFDLARRGPGAIFGTMQSGHDVFPIWEMDPALLDRARRVAGEIAASDAGVTAAHLE